MDWSCKCGGTISEDSPGVDWDEIDETCIARSDLSCDTCERKYSVFYELDRIECQECGYDVDRCECEIEEEKEKGDDKK